MDYVTIGLRLLIWTWESSVDLFSDAAGSLQFAGSSLAGIYLYGRVTVPGGASQFTESLTHGLLLRIALSGLAFLNAFAPKA